MDWKNFDKNVDVDGLKKDIEEAEKNGGNFAEVPYGAYEVTVDKMELVISKTSKKPMVSVWFKILDGKFKNSRIFMNQVVESGVQFNIMHGFLKSLDTGKEAVFESYSQYAEMIADVYEVASTMEYALDYGKSDKGYNTFKITEVFE